MKLKLLQFSVLALLTSLAITGIGMQLPLVQGNPFIPSQIVSPFTEMQPGVYVAWEWWNESGSDYAVPMEPVYYTDSNYTETGYEYLAEYYVEDTFGNNYTITENSFSDWSSEWAFSHLLVVILLDPDASYMAWMADQGNVTDLWSIYWWPEGGALSGDEVFIYSSFYYNEYNSSSYYYADYELTDGDGFPVDANSVIPNLTDEYQWASYMNETIEYDYDWNYSGFGYDVNEMFRTEDTEQWIQHYFSGMSVFNDTNDNGIMDLVYDEIEYDWDGDGEIDWVGTEMNRTASELKYDFYADNAEVGEIVTPHLNENNQIEWSAEVVDIQGNLMEYYPINACYCIWPPIDPVDQDAIPVTIDALELTFKFETTNTAAVIKIDQYVGDFTDPDTGLIPEELEDLGLTLNYWSSFSSYTIVPQVPVDPVPGDPTDPIGINGSVYDVPPTTEPSEQVFTDVPTEVNETSEVVDGFIQFSEEQTLRSTVEFGGTYVWGRDGSTYDVGTAIMPMYFYDYSYGGRATAAELTSAVAGYGWWQTSYYSSSYANWDGYSITHDPIFSVFPLTAPFSASAFISGLIGSSVVVGVIGLVAISVVLVRINNERKVK
ncbi:MAG: hypothetical protein ACXAAK_06995 [Candidatus Thorarchaeota archaeon]|jgi:hypothetical protein